MKRDLDLGEITDRIFLRKWDALGLKPPYTLPTHGDKSPRYFGIKNLVGYESAAKLIKGINDSLQVARCLWVPDSVFSKDKAISLTLRRDVEYLRFLPKIAEESGELFVQTGRKLKQRHNNNKYRFKRDNGFWYLAAGSISHKDFGSYGCFRNINPRLSGNKTPSVEVVVMN